jgi:NRAMP (natural resistance-associated macrophage protein)-like metal ion transporter
MEGRPAQAVLFFICYTYAMTRKKGAPSFLKKALHIAGPGFITGAADDDPSGIATYTQTGAQFGYGQLWTALAMLPFMVAIQEAAARIGAVTGKGIAAIIKERYGKTVLYGSVLLVVIANTVNIGADIGAMGAAAELLVPLNFGFLILIFTAFILVLEISTSYKTYARILKWFALALLSYPLTVFLVHEPWREILHATFVPHIELSFAFLFIVTGVLGTTISPYMFFWEASEEVEEEKERGLFRKGRPLIGRNYLRELRIDTFAGMLSSEIATWCIIVVAATVLHGNGTTNVSSAADAARALEPLVHTFPNAGFLAKLIFAAGIIGLGLLAVPVLSASASYALSETLEWKSGLNLKFRRAHGFYGVITVATLIGLCINFMGLNPIKALVYTAVLNGVAAVPLIFLIGRIAQSKAVMGRWKSGPLSQIFVWATFGLMAAAAIATLITFAQSL